MPSKSKPLNEEDLEAYEATRDLAAELLQSVREMKAGQVQVVTSPVIEARKKTGLSQSQFAALLGVSVIAECPVSHAQRTLSVETRVSPLAEKWTDIKLPPDRQLDDQ